MDNVVAKELALDIAQGVYRPQLVQHVPGLANKSADALSREACSLPLELECVIHSQQEGSKRILESC